MQGNLDEIDIRSILQLIELGQRTGVLFVENGAFKNSWGAASYKEETQYRCWFVFFQSGQIAYASDGAQKLSRLDDYLRHYRVKLKDKFTNDIFDLKVRQQETPVAFCTSHSLPEYTYLWALLEQNIINTSQARSIIEGLIHETIFDLLNLQQGNFIFEVTSPLAPVLTTWETVVLTLQTIRQVQDWKLLYPYIESPDQLPMLASVVRLQSSMPTATASKLKQWADGKTSLRQLARYLGRDILTVAKALYPYVQQGWVHMVYTNTIDLVENQPTVKEDQIEKKTIVFIDSEKSICSSVQSLLMSEGFNTCVFSNSIEALNGIFTLKPNLILSELTMPELNGYEICAMLRSCQGFRYLPIIMLTEQNDFISCAKAKMMGSSGFLSKPFNNAELVMLVKKYLNNPALGNNKNTALVDYTQYRVKNNITEQTKTHRL
ncbi:response regulator receiver protein [Calothrix sp. NIES-4071]|nr:response regulator receiver protein [Calothrix sp. NIES-4071]BAZ64323.1 response regulator receiver protein [Calothrix sp. NIES-4105]